MIPRSADIALRAHPSTSMDAASAVRALRVRVARAASRLDLLFTLEGELARLRLPPARAPMQGNDLWRSTCFEAFAMAEGPGYCELNVTPAHAWALYRFSGYRHASAAAESSMTPNISQLSSSGCVRAACDGGPRALRGLRSALANCADGGD